jgi:hypothetical protein
LIQALASSQMPPLAKGLEVTSALKSETRCPVRCDGATARREEIRDPKFEFVSCELVSPIEELDVA